MDINAAMVRDLREKSGAGMMDCKRALEETGGDMEKAFDHLRKQGLKSAEKKASREMGEGRVHAVARGNRGAILAVTCETDFVARTPNFETFLNDLTDHVLEHRPATLDALLAQKWKTGVPVSEAVKEAVGKLGENISLARMAYYENPKGVVGAYVHHNNKVGVLVSVTTDKADRAADVLKDLCLHIAAIKPEFLARSEVPAETLEREKEIYRVEVAKRPPDIQEKILAGKLEKFYADRVLPEQPWVKDDKSTVQKVLTKELGQGAAIAAFSRFEIG